jgi:WD40 repeat protein
LEQIKLLSTGVTLTKSPQSLETLAIMKKSMISVSQRTQIFLNVSNYSEVFATSSINDIRVWNSKSRQELLRIEVPGLECESVKFMCDGKSIISGWNDGKIRSFLPQSGKLYYAINDAHNHGVTSLASTSTCDRIVSGGMEGEVRIWRIGRQTQHMEASLKEHRSRVNDVHINKGDT